VRTRTLTHYYTYICVYQRTYAQIYIDMYISITSDLQSGPKREVALAVTKQRGAENKFTNTNKYGNKQLNNK